ncbi:MAG: 4-hydroxyphenylpyruvate dioxygenase [Phormidesmis priestleyi]|uniref:4-hydroxyphenylpyruvate dioxygenase n=1 Tax=Phormidesmis priestleyi TaxID=268141 RepID=A0A2W4WGK1_9CYAN|nr:MAG: 4-hydroxyphenylpyruvate dioxygenase [Phormidesmis priestleyi]
MHFHHLHFYVQDVAFWRDWFVHKLAFQTVAELAHTAAAPGSKLAKFKLANDKNAVSPTVLQQGMIEIWLSGPTSAPTSTVKSYLQQHPPGLVDVGFASDRFDQLLSRVRRQGIAMLSEVTVTATGYRQCQIQGWADLRHTLVEVSPQWAKARASQLSQPELPWLSRIDHAVLNVPKGQLTAASNWYQQVFGLEAGQQFDINTTRSGLRSQVLIDPDGTVQIPINEPTSANSQIQEFLHHNRGAGIQHVALRSGDAVSAIAHFRQQGLKLISVPDTYYQALKARTDCPVVDTSAASRQQVLLDWPQGGQQGMLLQTFTQPIFAEPTFFFEIIERSTYREAGQIKQAQGFGEGNFRALFEAIEQAQIKRSNEQSQS